jgi:2,3-bisphosphoglycerate-dependent phosphoglycerate mutase
MRTRSVFGFQIVNDMATLVLLRHGESIWDRENRFCGWADVRLTASGLAAARNAGRLLRNEGLTFDVAYSSVLKRAYTTLYEILDEMDLGWIPVYKTWALNERHCGQSEGEFKGVSAADSWQHSFTLRPPAIHYKNGHPLAMDPRYAEFNPQDLPRSESLSDILWRVLLYWNHDIAPQLRLGRRVMVVSHGDPLRCLAGFLDGTVGEELCVSGIRAAVPLVYQLDAELKPVSRCYADKFADEPELSSLRLTGKHFRYVLPHVGAVHDVGAGLAPARGTPARLLERSSEYGRI